MRDRSQLRIVCAANKHKGVMPLLVGARHWDMIMHKQFELMNLAREAMGIKSLHSSEFTQGFIDNMGEFWTREEAFIIATAANQILEKTGGEDSVKLFSEDLY